MGTLYLVSTPIGNLGDISLRAIEILKSVDLILCEDTRKTANLLQKLTGRQGGQLISFYEENEESKIPRAIELLRQGAKIALVSNAGTPLISDPGFKLVREVVRHGIRLEAVPGPSAVMTALAVSGLPTDRFMFVGFLPKKEIKLQTILKKLPVKTTIVFFESPYRLLATLKEIQKCCGDITLVICREMTKVHEEVRREKVSEAIDHFQKTKPLGEFTCLFYLSENREG